MPKYQRLTNLSAAQQAVRVTRRFPQFRPTRLHPELVLLGWIQPRPLSSRYQIRISKRSGRTPRVFVESPPLRPGAPHVYRDGDLCLFWPKEWSWSDTDDMSTTILPWTASWLLYYELWTETDEWLGPSSPHAATSAKSA
jgi:hypothetical protein